MYILQSQLSFVAFSNVERLKIGHGTTGTYPAYPSEKWWSEFVTWDDDIPNMNGKIKAMLQTTNKICIYFSGQSWFQPKDSIQYHNRKHSFKVKPNIHSISFHHFIIRTSNPPILFPRKKTVENCGKPDLRIRFVSVNRRRRHHRKPRCPERSTRDCPWNPWITKGKWLLDR